MNKFILSVLTLLVVNFCFAQKLQKIKGSKIVVIQQKKIDVFDTVEIQDDIEVFLIKGEKSGIELEADDNLQEALNLRMNGSSLLISMANEVSGYKKFAVRITYSSDLKLVTSKNKSKVTALETVKLNNISFKALDNSKMFLNVDSKDFSMMITDKARVELNSKSENTVIDLSKNATLKALITASNLKCDLYQKSEAEIEGDVIDFILRTDNNSVFKGKKLNSKKLKLVAEADSECMVNAETSIAIEASGSSEVQLFGNAKIDLIKFNDTATLAKKNLK